MLEPVCLLYPSSSPLDFSPYKRNRLPDPFLTSFFKTLPEKAAEKKLILKKYFSSKLFRIFSAIF